MVQRECGECRACCIIPGFKASPEEAPFSKPPGEPCVHLAEHGCSIYPERPPVCRRFQCAWLSAPNLPDALRPDRCGVMFSTNENVVGEGYAVYAHELWPGALEGELPRWLIDQVADEITVILVPLGRPVEVLTSDSTVQQRLSERKRSPRR